MTLYKVPDYGWDESFVDDVILEPKSGMTGFRGGRPKFGGTSVAISYRTSGCPSTVRPKITFKKVGSNESKTNPETLSPGLYMTSVSWTQGGAFSPTGRVVIPSRASSVGVILDCQAKKVRVTRSDSSYGATDQYGSPQVSVNVGSASVQYQGGSWDTLGALAIVAFAGYGIFRGF